MRKLGVRVVSAALAACMMASALPVGAFAAGTGYDGDVAAYAEEGGSSASTPLEPNVNRITAGGTYIMNAAPTRCIAIETTDDVTIEITKNVTFEPNDYPISGGTEIKQSSMFRVVNVGKLTINGNNNTVNTAGRSFMITDSAASDRGSITSLTVNGGTYE